ncbi:hypothetical protein HWV62_16546 [Athelia sp. TMB]|nr:hypothetical protein HWV62_16546 [Athelia sp. TMB]
MSSSPYYQQQAPAPAYDNAHNQDQGYQYQQTAYSPSPYRPVRSASPPHSRGLARTPSPTPSEARLLAGGKTFDLRASLAPKRENMWFIIGFVLLLVVLIVFAVLHDKIIIALQPAAKWVAKTKGGWAIPLGLIFVLSFPPLFGADLVSVMAGVVYGPLIGFGIVAAGVLLGELANYFTFKYACSARSEKLKQTNVKYACLARVVQEGGLPVAVVARYSVIPSHVATALFATCGMQLWVFVASAVASLPKNFVNVYIGYAFEAEATGAGAKKSKLINIVLVGVTAVVTVFAMRFIDAKINAVKEGVVYERRKARGFGASQERLVDPSMIALQPPKFQEPRYEQSV